MFIFPASLHSPNYCRCLDRLNAVGNHLFVDFTRRPSLAQLQMDITGKYFEHVVLLTQTGRELGPVERIVRFLRILHRQSPKRNSFRTASTRLALDPSRLAWARALMGPCKS